MPGHSGAASAFDGVAVGDGQGPRRGVALPRDTTYITSAQTRVLTGLVAHLIQFDKISYKHWCILVNLNPKNWKY